MIQRLLHLGFLFAAPLMALLGCNRRVPKTEAVHEFPDFTFSKLKTAEDVQAAVDHVVSHANAILLVHVDWAPMVHQRQRFAEFQHDYKIRFPNSDLVFLYLDCTPITDGYEPLRSLPGWEELEERNNGSSLVHGYGELVWYKNGRVLHVERPLNFDSAEALMTKTESLGMVGIAK